jgi:hypothetical protein
MMQTKSNIQTPQSESEVISHPQMQSRCKCEPKPKKHCECENPNEHIILHIESSTICHLVEFAKSLMRDIFLYTVIWETMMMRST